MFAPIPRRLSVLLTFAFLAVLIRTAWIADDALITLRTVLNVTHGFGLTFNIAERVQTFTHPLWALLLTLVYMLVGNVYVATFALAIITSSVAFWLALRGAASAWQAGVVAAVLLFSRAFVDFSTSGLENPLACVLIATFLWVFTTGLPRPHRRLLQLATLTSLLYLTRPDSVLLVLPLLIVACAQTGRPGTIMSALAIGALPAIAWTAFSVVYYGFPLPNTAYAKLGTAIPRMELWVQGVLYLIDSIDRDPLTLTVIAFAIASSIESRRLETTAFAGGVLLYVLFVVSIGGDFMAGRFLAVPVYASALILSRQIRTGRSVWIASTAVFVVLGATSAHVPLRSDSRFSDTTIRPNGIADERGFYFQGGSLVGATRAGFDTADWEAARQSRTRPEVKVTCGQLGALGLELGPHTHLLDECALADPLLAHVPAAFDTQWRAGHYRRLIPAGYQESLANDSNVLEDDGLRLFYEDTRLITRSDDLFSAARWRAIVRANTGRNQHLVDASAARFGPAILTLPDLMTIVPDETPWDGPGTHALGGPIAIRCDDKPGRRYLSVSLNSEARYRIVFLRRNSIVGSLELGPVPGWRSKPGLATHALDIPPRTSSVGFDLVVVAAVSKAETHPSLGYMLLDGYGPTDAELQNRVRTRLGGITSLSPPSK